MRRISKVGRLRSVTVNNPKKPHSFLMANAAAPMDGILFEDVVVNNPGGENYWEHCEGVARGSATGKTSPVPPCFQDMTGKPPRKDAAALRCIASRGVADLDTCSCVAGYTPRSEPDINARCCVLDPKITDCSH